MWLVWCLAALVHFVVRMVDALGDWKAVVEEREREREVDRSRRRT